MKNTSVIISTYTADVSGVCSALYELGGMVVIHDPSGCNSTYNTHDEPRWYDQDSLVFISGLSEIDAIMGSDDKLIDDISRAAKQLKPRFIALVQTPVPMMTGIDFYGIRDILKEKTGLPVYFFPTNGMHSYIQGVNMALAAVAEDMVDKTQESVSYTQNIVDKTQDLVDKQQDSAEKTQDLMGNRKNYKVNLLGVTPLDFSVNTSLSSVKSILQAHGFELISCFAMRIAERSAASGGTGISEEKEINEGMSTADEIARAGEADVNLVLSSAGIEAARVLYRRFSTPYVVGLPTGAFADVVIEDMRKAIKTGNSIISYIGVERSEHDTAIYIIGEAVAVQSIREAARMKYGINLKVLIYLETPEDLMDEQCIYVTSEDEIRDRLADAEIVIADPMYKPVCPGNARFIPFPHEAFSGRIYRREIPDLTRPREILFREGHL